MVDIVPRIVPHIDSDDENEPEKESDIQYDIQYIIQCRQTCLDLFENIRDLTRDDNPPLFDKVSIESLVELLYPEEASLMYELGI